MLKNFFLRKPLHAPSAEQEGGAHTLRRHLGSLNLVTIGIGAIIGAGIFVITGQAAAEFAGPAIVFSTPSSSPLSSASSRASATQNSPP